MKKPGLCWTSRQVREYLAIGQESGKPHTDESGWGFSGQGDLKQQSTGGGGASRFFYCSKASRKERDYGCEDLPDNTPSDLTGGRKADSAGINNPRAGAGRTSGGKNPHPTVKPVDLMRWLVRLAVPKGGHVLDPFAGSGSTGVAALLEGRRFTGIEKDFDYSMVACARLTQADADSDG